MLKHVILGNGAAGITAAAKLREAAANDYITIISGEAWPVYSKPMLPDYIGGRLSKDKLFLRSHNFYHDSNIELVRNNPCKNIDAQSKRVILNDGTSIEYDRLLIAVGGTPFIPPVEGLGEVSCFTLNSLDDADRIRRQASEGGRAVIMGAGLTGIETGFALKALGMEVCIIEREKRILPLQMDFQSSEVMLETIRNEGIKILMETTVVKAVNGERNTVLLSDGTRLPFDMLVVSSGTRPNVTFAAECGIKTGRGIIVNEFMETSCRHIYAAGDAAELVDGKSGGGRIACIWPNAMNQGRAAAFSMAGYSQGFSIEAARLNQVQMRDIPFVSMGLVNPEEDCEILTRRYDSGAYRRLVIKNGVVKGMILIGDTRSLRSIGELIRKGVDTSEFRHRLLEEEFVLK